MKKYIVLAGILAICAVGCKSKSVEEKLAEFNQWNEDLIQEYTVGLMSFRNDDAAAEAYADSIINVFYEYNLKALKENLDNVIGVEALKNVYSVAGPGDYEEYLDKITAPLHGRDSAFVEGLRESLNAGKATAEGQMFTDFEVDGVKFSDYVGRGKYILVDFWASWCNPCRKEIPNIRAVYEEFAGESFDVLSIAVWDKPEDTVVAAREENIVWNQIINAQTIPTDIYGIQGIPEIILFGPDGTILKRNLRGSSIRNAVAQALDR